MQYPILYSKVPDYRRRPPVCVVDIVSSGSGSTLSALQQELKPEVESPEREPARYRPNFRSTRRRRRRRASRRYSGHAPRWLNVVREEDIVVGPSPVPHFNAGRRRGPG